MDITKKAEFTIKIPPQVEWILKKLRDSGYEAFAVGGCVRDTILNRKPGDWDITTSARPEQVKAVFGKTVDTGLQHGTVTVIRDHVGYEITTYRIDGEYEDGRHPREVEFTSDLREDLRRRDFTINAMAYSPETGLVDIFGGMEDLKNRTIRCVGNAVERFGEDALRIMRAVRFASQLDFSIEEETYRALSGIAPNLAHVSKERIQVELTKTLLSGRPQGVLVMEDTGMCPYMTAGFPGIFSKARESGINLEERLKRSALLPQEKSLRYAVFLGHLGEKGACTILRELKLDNDTIRRVKTLVHFMEETLPEDGPALRRMMSQMEDSLFDSLLLMRKTVFPEQMEDVLKTESRCRRVRERGDCIRLKDLAVTGNDLIAAGMKPGKEMGERLRYLFELVLSEPALNEKELLLKAACDARKEQPDGGQNQTEKQ